MARDSWEPPRKQKPKRSLMSRLVMIIAILVLVISLGALALIGLSYWWGQNAYDKLEDDNFAAGATLADFKVDWDGLRAINSDIVGWIYIPDTPISYPVVHRANDDYYYLYHNFNHESAAFGAEYGAIALSGANNPDFTDENNLIYGHNMANGTMFSNLADFADDKVFNEHRTIFLLTPKGNYRLTTFALDRVLETETIFTRPNFGTRQAFTEFVQKILDGSIVTPNPKAPAAQDIDQVFAFSTCDNSNDIFRFITFAYVSEFLSAAEIEAIQSSTASESAGSWGISDTPAISVGDVDRVGADTQARTE